MSAPSRPILPGENDFAFPQPVTSQPDGEIIASYDFAGAPGMSTRDYACIHLKVPESGQGWLNDLIEESRRLDHLARL